MTMTTLLRWLDEYEAAGVASPVAAVVARYTAICEPRRSAYHETGHAVAAVLVDFPPRRVTITPSAGRAGHYELAMTPEEVAGRIHETPDGLARYLTVLLAGKIAEDLVAVDEQEGLSALEDYMWAGDAASRHVGSDQAKAEMVKVEAQCEVWFREPAIRAAIDAVAKALLDRQTLTGAEVTAIVRAEGVTAKGDDTHG
jgi:ATP-dependent Zn protease